MSRTILKTPPSRQRAERHYQFSDTPDANEHASSPNGFERLHTIREAAELAGLKYWLLLRAVNRGDVPSYQFGNQRKRVRLSDIEAAIAHFQAGAPIQ